MSAPVIRYIDEPHPVTGVTNGKFGLWLFLASEVMLFGALFSSYILLRVGAKSWPDGWERLNVPLATANTVVLITSSVTMVMAWVGCKLNDLGKFRFYMGITVALSFVFLVIKTIEYKPKFEHYQVYFYDGATIPGYEELTTITGHLEEDDFEKDYIVFAPDKKQPSQTLPDAEGHGDHDHAEGDHDDHGHGHYADPIQINRYDIKRLTNFGPAHSNFYAIYFTMTGLHGLHVIGGIVVNLYFLLFGAGMFRSNIAQFSNRIECAGLYWHFVDLVWIFLFPSIYLL